MIDLYTAVKLLKIEHGEVVCIRRDGSFYDYCPSFYTGKEIREKFDMRKEKIVKIAPYFNFGEFKCFALTLAKR